MKLNLKFYNGKDEYSDGDIEDKIIDFIKKYPDNYEKAFAEDSSWPVFYHLSDLRKNVIRWYPFKKDANLLEVGGGMGALTEELIKKCKHVTSIELSKKRATAILERNKNAKNLEIIVGNFKDIILKEKYDYILLNGVLEYAAMYVDTENPYEDFINLLKENLKDDGKILIAIENQYGLKYWCGANEDHTNLKFDGILDYQSKAKIKTFSKVELENLAFKCNFNINFYYMFPDYKFPKVIYTDLALHKNLFSNYIPYYYKNTNLFLNETLLYKKIYDNKVIPFFTNSFFVELSNNKSDIQIEFVKYNNEYRKKEYNLYTYLQNNQIIKKVIEKEGINQIENINKIYNLALDNKLNIISVIKKKDLIVSPFITGTNLQDLLNFYFNNNLYDKIYEVYDCIYKLIKDSVGKSVSNCVTIFQKYNFLIDKDKLENLHFYKNGFLDIIPSNILLKDNKYFLMDQEWYEENVPIEYIMFRAIYYFFDSVNSDLKLANELYSRYNIDFSLFLEFEKVYIEDIRNSFYYYFCEYGRKYNYIKDVDNLIDVKIPELNNLNTNLQKRIIDVENKNISLNVENERLNKVNKKLETRLSLILNSKGYRLLNKYYQLRNHFKIK